MKAVGLSPCGDTTGNRPRTGVAMSDELRGALERHRDRRSRKMAEVMEKVYWPSAACEDDSLSDDPTGEKEAE